MLGGSLYNSCYACGTTLLPLRESHILAPGSIRRDGSNSPVGFSWGFICDIEFDQIYFTDQLAWGSFVRMIMVLPRELCGSDKDHYHLSGIGLTPGAHMFEVPPHRHQLFIGNPENRLGQSDKLMGVFPARWHGAHSIFPYGYSIHARCWHLLERLVGSVTDKDLKCLVHALQNISKDSSFETYGSPHMTPEDVEPWVKSGIGFYDPVKIPALRGLIDKSIERRRRENSSDTRNPRPGLFQDVRYTMGPHNIPLEIQLLVTDLLDYRDITPLLRAFGWILPDKYWATRTPKSLIFEIRDLDLDFSGIDWQFLSLGVEKLRQTCPQLLNRQRLFPVMEKISHLFREEVALKKQRELEEDDVQIM